MAGVIDRPLGFAYAELLSTNELELLRIGVRPDSRQQGIGRLMINVIGSTLPLCLTLRETSIDALLFSRAVGFRASELIRKAFENCDGIRLRRKPEKFPLAGLTGG